MRLELRCPAGGGGRGSELTHDVMQCGLVLKAAGMMVSL